MESLKNAHLQFLDKQVNQKKVSAVKINKPIGRDILEFLDPHKAKTAEEIRRETGIDINGNPILLKELKMNPMVIFREPGEFLYKPMFALKNKDDLFERISKSPEGIDFENLKDCYKGVEQDIQALVDSRKVLKVLDSETKHNIIYPFDSRFQVDVFPEFQQMWAQIRIPDSIDLENEMSKAGLTMMEQEKMRTKRPAKKSGSR